MSVQCETILYLKVEVVELTISFWQTFASHRGHYGHCASSADQAAGAAAEAANLPRLIR